MKALLVVTAYSSVMIAAVLAMRAIWNGKINSKIIRFLWLLVLIRLLLPITFESPVHFDGIFPESQAAVGVSPVEDPALEVPFTPAVDAQAPGEYYEKQDMDLVYAEGSTPAADGGGRAIFFSSGQLIV